MFRYDRLWKLLIDQGMKKTDLINNVGLTPSTLSRLSKNENVSMDTLDRICSYFSCSLGEIVEHIPSFDDKDKSLGTFVPNKSEKIHRWFSYLEGYSKPLVEDELSRIGKIQSILDPFGGSGTTQLVAAANGIKSFFCEVNPAMSFIANTKINSSIQITSDSMAYQELLDARYYLDKELKSYLPEVVSSDFGGFSKYFSTVNLSKIIKAKSIIERYDNPVKSILLVALASVAIPVSKMVRRGDLRFAKGKELKNVSRDFTQEYLEILDKIILDLSDDRIAQYVPTNHLGEDIRDVQRRNLVDAVITSPPYLNGTNYVRNTKLELKLLDFVNTESDLAKFHSKGIISGINNVSKRNGEINVLDCVEPYYKRVSENAYDVRIPKMIAGYFSDMFSALSTIYALIKPNGWFVMDIGDSQFGGVHIPTHELLSTISEQIGFIKINESVLRSRRSPSGFQLSQRIIRFRKG